MVHTNIMNSTIKEPYHDIRKGKTGSSSSGQQQDLKKNDKYGAWGPVYKNKQNFVDMHIC